jgi:hypothetical protein
MYLTFGQQCLSVEGERRPSIEDIFCFFVAQGIGWVISCARLFLCLLTIGLLI